MSDIWSDADVQQIFLVENGQPQLRLPDLDAANRALMLRFIEADQNVNDIATPRLVIEALVAGVAAFENFSEAAPNGSAAGWRKFVLFMTACNVQILWEQLRQAGESAIFADWVTSAIQDNQWGPDGHASALGRAHSHCMAIATEAGGGIRPSPTTGVLEASSGHAARTYDPEHGVVAQAAPPSNPPKRGLFRGR